MTHAKNKICFKKSKNMNILKRIETSGELFLVLVPDKSYTSNLSIEPEKVEQNFSKSCFLDNIDKPRRVRNQSHKMPCGFASRLFLIYSSMRDAAIKPDFQKRSKLRSMLFIPSNSKNTQNFLTVKKKLRYSHNVLQSLKNLKLIQLIFFQVPKS